MTLAEKINNFNRRLELNAPLPENVEVMNPYSDDAVFALTVAFYSKFYADNKMRRLILGINPGRFGAGVTGIPFTDPLKLSEKCNIENDLKKSTEPSAGFIYDMIDAFGGPKTFYSKYLIHSVCPLGFTKNGNNFNYYDDKQLEKSMTPFIIESIEKLINLDIDNEFCYCLGNGKNFNFLNKLNDHKHFFKRVIPLPHPRWVVQYRRKKYDTFIQYYLEILK